MKLTLAAVMGALAVLAPLSSAAAVAQRDTVAVQGLGLEPRASSQGDVHRKHHEKNRKKIQKAKIYAAATSRRKKKHSKTSFQPASTTPVARVVTSTSKAATSTPITSSKAPVSTGTGTGSTQSSFQTDMLNIHNADRAKHSAAPLVWDATLTAAAAKWAANCKWGHTPNNPYGQNIAAATWSTFGAKDATDMWYDEYKLYDYAKGDYTEATGHFTQMVWKGSKKLGCVLQQCTAAQLGLGQYGGNANYVVCNYDPPGNWIGEFKENVSPN